MEPALADPATAALTSDRLPQPEEGAPPEGQEDPYGMRPDDAPEDSPELPAPAEVPESGELRPEDNAPAAVPSAAEPQPPLPAPPAAAPQQPPAAEPDDDGARDRYWLTVLTGSPDTVPDAVRERAGAMPGEDEAQREYRLLSTINRSWAVDHLGISREQVRTGWARLRAELAGRYRVADDEQELFTALSAATQDAPRRAAAQALYEKSFRAALLGREDTAAEGIAPGVESFPFSANLAAEGRSRGESLRQRYLPLARELAAGLDAFASVEEDAVAAPRVFAAVPELAASIEALAGLAEGERALVYTLAQDELRQARKGEGASEGIYGTMLRAGRRGSINLGIGVGQALAHAVVAGMNSLGSTLGVEYGASLRERAAGLDLRARLFDECRHLLQDEVQPLDIAAESGFAAQLAVDAMGATPAAILACSGGAGFAALSVSGLGESVAAARRRAPEGRQWMQYLAGLLGSGIQAGIYCGMGRVGGQLLSNAIARFARASGKGARGYTLASLETLGAAGIEQVKLLLASKAAAGAELGAHEIAARLDRTASNIDWSEYGENATDLEMNMREAAMNLPFILIGSGRVALHHFRSRRTVLGEGERLLDWGIDEATRDAIMNEPSPTRQSELLRDALRGSKRWSAPGFLAEAMRALRLLNTDYYQGFKDPQTVADFLNLPSQGGLVPPRLPAPATAAGEPHGGGRNNARLQMALALWDEWTGKANLVPAATPESGRGEGAALPPIGSESGALLTTAQRRGRYGQELMLAGNLMPRRMQPGGFYAPQAEAERMALLRDRVAELNDLSYQLLLSANSVDSLCRGTRGPERLRADGEKARQSMLEAVACYVLARATGRPEHEAGEALSRSIDGFYTRRKYRDFPPGWMSRVRAGQLRHLTEFAQASAQQELDGLPPEMVDAFRVSLGFRSCANALCELLPTSPDFQTALSRGMTPAAAYVHLMSRELGVDFSRSRAVQELLEPLGGNATDMASYTQRNMEAYEQYRLLTGNGLESAAGEGGNTYWRLRRPNGHYTRWHREREHAVNDMVANTSFAFLPFGEDAAARYRRLLPGQPFELETPAAGFRQFTAFDHLCSIALRDTARSWLELAPYAQPGFELGQMRRYYYTAGKYTPAAPVMQERMGAPSGSLTADLFSLSSPLRVVQARFRTYWWRQLNSGLLPAEDAGRELLRLGVINEAERQRVMDIAKPLLMPKNPNVPLRLTPPPDIEGRNSALAAHLTDFSTRYFLAHLDEMPLPPSAREWYRLAPFCPPQEEGTASQRLSLAQDGRQLTAYANRQAAQELRGYAQAIDSLRRDEAAGLLEGSRFLPEMEDALGLNPRLNLEQAWCMNHSGAGAFMASSQTFWRLMESPLEGWQAMGESEQAALRAHVEELCRTEPTPEALEAEARGETPDYVLSALRDLDELLRAYPELHHYDLAVEADRSLVRSLELSGRPEDAAAGIDNTPFAEPEYGVLPLYAGGLMQEGYRLTPPQALPESLQGDTRIMPALHLLAALRSFPGSRPFARREGIQWKGQLYGGIHGERPRGLGEDWEVEQPLAPLVSMLERVDALRRDLPEGEVLTSMDEPLEGVEGLLGDMTPLANVTLYRSRRNPALTCRLMPGDADSAHAEARSPYVAQALAGVYMRDRGAVKGDIGMPRAYTPLELFHPIFPRFGLEQTMGKHSHEALSYTLGSLLHSTRGDGSAAGSPGMRELLLRLVDDSGFSRSIRSLDPRELTYGQLLTLRLAREMLLCVCGREPHEAAARLGKFCQRLRDNEETREAVLRALTGAALDAFREGKPFRVVQRREREQKKKKYRSNDFVTPDERRSLLQWMNRNERGMRVWDSHQNEEKEDWGYSNDEVRPDGYSRGFFDD